jgi:hypothetical protein
VWTFQVPALKLWCIAHTQIQRLSTLAFVGVVVLMGVLMCFVASNPLAGAQGIPVQPHVPSASTFLDVEACDWMVAQIDHAPPVHTRFNLPAMERRLYRNHLLRRLFDRMIKGKYRSVSDLYCPTDGWTGGVCGHPGEGPVTSHESQNVGEPCMLPTC